MRRSRVTLRAKDYAGTLLIVAVAATIGFGLQRAHVHPANFALLFLTSVLVSAIIYGLWPALCACIVSLLVYNFFFLPPLFTFTIAGTDNIVTLFFFGVVAVVGSNVAARLRRQNVVAETERLRSAMLTSLSHDLRTPLASILGAASSLKMQRASLSADSQDELISTIGEEAERLHRFIGNLLDMTRLDSGAIHPNIQPVDLSDVTGTALHRAEPLLSEHRVVVDFPPDLPLVGLDPVLFEQVLFNLLDNAAKYTPPQTRIELRARDKGQTVQLDVEDEGEGIPAGETERIFDRFHRAQSKDRKRAGTGLGLAICRGFLNAMKGSIVAANRLGGRGAVFTITVPVAAQRANPMGPA
jgi:K+-sensing histidine kinase KdpD